MRSLAFLTAVLLVGLSSATRAQSAFEGPLAAPSDQSPAPASARLKKPLNGAAKKKAGSSASHAAGTEMPRVPAQPVAEPGAKTSAPVSPLSLGMKWNGSNDNAGQTRVQNYNGNAQGTGAEVGLKLHF